MSTEVSSSTSTPQASDPAWGRAREWVKIGSQVKGRKLVAEVMTGLELVGLHRKHKIKRGQPQKELRHGVAILFKDLISTELSITARTAQRRMRMVKTIRKETQNDALSGSVQAALAGEPVDLTPETAAEIATFVEQVTQGRTQKDLLPRVSRPRKGPDGAPKAVAAVKGGAVLVDVLRALTETRGQAVPAPRPVATKVETLPVATTGKSTPAMRLMADYTESFPCGAELQEEIERLEKVLQLCRQWQVTELGQRDMAVLRAQLRALREAA